MPIDPAPSPPAAEDAVPTLLTLAEVAETLRCSEKTIRRRIDAGTLPASKQGGRWLFEAAAIRAALIAGMTRPKSAPSAPSFNPACTAPGEEASS
jgi:excisionase family DNA binding protein